MASAVNFRRLAAAIIAIAGTAVMIWFGNGLNPWWPLMWFFPLPVLLFSLRASWWSAALTAFTALLLGSLNMWPYLRALAVPFAGWLSIFSSAAFVFALAVLLFQALLRRCAPWTALLAFPAVWVVAEYVRNLVTPHGTAGSLAYTQLHFLPFLQLASITGPWGMSFLLLLFPAALAVGLHLRHTAPKRAMQIAAAVVGLVVLVLAFGAIRLALPAPSNQIKVGLVASDLPGNEDIADSGEKTELLFQKYAAQVEKLATEGAQVIVLPEKVGVVVDSGATTSDAIFQPLADKTKSTIVVGMVYANLPALYNRARVYSPGVPPRNYDKHHMLPPFESKLMPGTTSVLWPEPSGTEGVEICKDMDFTQLSRQYGKAGAGVLFVPAWDFRIDRAWHGHIAIMRGVEDGFAIARAAKDGYLTVSDNRGRIVAETRSDSAPFAALIADVPTTHATTLYLLLGDWFAWVAIAALVFACFQLYWTRGRMAAQSP